MFPGPNVPVAPSAWDLPAARWADSRTPISDAVRREVARQLASIPEGKTGALIGIADEHGARVHLAARLGDNWKIAFEAGTSWQDPQFEGQVAIVGAWGGAK